MDRKGFQRKFAAIPRGAVGGSSWWKLDLVAARLKIPKVYQKLNLALRENSFHAEIVPAGLPKKIVLPILTDNNNSCSRKGQQGYHRIISRQHIFLNSF